MAKAMLKHWLYWCFLQSAHGLGAQISYQWELEHFYMPFFFKGVGNLALAVILRLTTQSYQFKDQKENHHAD